jgi:hypothetical protein
MYVHLCTTTCMYYIHVVPRPIHLLTCYLCGTHVLSCVCVCTCTAVPQVQIIFIKYGRAQVVLLVQH